MGLFPVFLTMPTLDRILPKIISNLGKLYFCQRSLSTLATHYLTEFGLIDRVSNHAVFPLSSFTWPAISKYSLPPLRCSTQRQWSIASRLTEVFDDLFGILWSWFIYQRPLWMSCWDGLQRFSITAFEVGSIEKSHPTYVLVTNHTNNQLMDDWKSQASTLRSGVWWLWSILSSLCFCPVYAHPR